jgi:hypothetical protein
MPNELTISSSLLVNSRWKSLVKSGLNALLARDLALIDVSIRSKVADSLDLDSASKDEYPQSNRWDYILSVSSTAELIGLEPHSAKDSEISVLILKKKHAAAYLRSHLRDGVKVKRWIWVTHGKVKFSRMDKLQRSLSQNGIFFAGRLLKSLL